MAQSKDIAEQARQRVVRRGLLRVWVHACAWVSFSVLGFVAGLFAAMFMVRSTPMDNGIVAALVLAGCTGLGAWVPAIVLIKFVSARCRRCGGRCWGKLERSFRYHCEECGRVVDSGIVPGA